MKRIDFFKRTLAAIAGIGLLSSFEKTSYNSIKHSSKKSITPKKLVKGDLVAITAPAGSIWNKNHIQKVEQVLAELGFKTIVGETCYLQHGYLAGTDEVRAKEFMKFIQQQNVKAILTMRGGWGCARILDLLDYDIIRQNPKIVMGFSDITALINAIWTKTGIITYHGPCGYSSWGDFTKSSAMQALALSTSYTLKNPVTYDKPLITIVPGKAQGTLIGGNLTVLVSLMGTAYEPDWTNALLFLEEIGEEPYRIDRMLWQLKQAGVFDKINGLIIGSFKKCQPEEPDKSFSLDEVLNQHFSSASFPVYQGAAIGHIAPKFTLGIGAMAEMDADNYSIKIF